MHSRYRLVITLIFSLLLLWSSFAIAAEVVFQPDGARGKDTWVGGGDPTLAHGSESYIYFGGYAGYEMRLYIQFDLSMVKSSSTVDQAQLEMYMFSQNGEMVFDYSVLRLAEPWNEATLTWNTQPARDDTEVVVFSGLGWQGGYGSWHAVTGLADLVKFWIDNPDQNYGLVIQPSSSFYGYPMLWSSDYSTSSLRPRLVLEGAIVNAEPTTWGGVKSLYR